LQKWIEQGVLGTVLEALALDLKERGEIDLSECYMDGTFVAAKKEGVRWKVFMRWLLVALDPIVVRSLCQ
jgi:hypothetical protein